MTDYRDQIEGEVVEEYNPLSKEDLFTPVLYTKDIPIPGKKGTVEIRSITREEMHKDSKNKDGEVDARKVEYNVLVSGMLNPRMTFKEVVRWASAVPAGHIQPVIKAILELSGLGKDADDIEGQEEFLKNAYKSTGE